MTTVRSSNQASLVESPADQTKDILNLTVQGNDLDGRLAIIDTTNVTVGVTAGPAGNVFGGITTLPALAVSQVTFAAPQLLTLDKFGTYTITAVPSGTVVPPIPANATTTVVVTARKLVTVGTPPLLVPSAIPFIVQAQDVTNALVTTFNGLVQLNLSDLSRAPGSPPDIRFVSAVNGIATFVVSDGRPKLVTAEAIDPLNQLFSSKFPFGSLVDTTLKGRRRPR